MNTKTLNKSKLDTIIQDFGSLIALIFLLIVLSVVSPDFRNINNLLSLLKQSSVNCLWYDRGYLNRWNRPFRRFCACAYFRILCRHDSFGSYASFSYGRCFGYGNGVRTNKRTSCCKGKTSAIYCNAYYYDRISRTYNDFFKR